MDGFPDQRLDWPRRIGVHGDQRLQAAQAGLRIVRMDRCRPSFVPGIPCIDKSRASGPRTSPTRMRSGRMRSVVRNQVRHRDLDRGMVLTQFAAAHWISPVSSRITIRSLGL